MKIKPLNDWAVVRPSEAASRTAGGIYIPETAKEKPAEGTVEAIGPGAFEEEKRGAKKEGKKERKFIPTSVKPGDRVLYERYAAQKISIDGEEMVLVREISILGTLPPAPVLPKEELPPLLLPHMTSSSSALTTRTTTALSVRKEPAGTAIGKPAKKNTVKKAVKKTAVKKTAKKSAAKTKPKTSKKTTARKTKKKR